MSHPVSTTSCRQTVSSQVSAYASGSKVPSVSGSKVKVTPVSATKAKALVSAKVSAHESSVAKSPRISSSESKVTSRVSITDSVSGSKAKTLSHESTDLRPKVALCLPVCEVKIPSYASASGSSVPSQVSSESVTTSRGSSSQPSVHCCASTSVDTRTWDISQKADSFPLYLDSFCPVNIKSSSNEELILSNFHSCSVSVKGYRRQFKSVEHAYQFCCAIFFGQDELTEAIFSSKSAAQAKFLSRRLLWHKENYPDLAHRWNSYKVTLMEDLLFEKSRCCKEFHDRLIETYPHQLTHNVFDGFWGFQDKAGHPGLDMFSKMLMKLRLRLILNSVQIYVPEDQHICTCTPNVTSQVSTGSLMCASAPSVFEQVPTSSVISGSGVFQQVPPGSVTSAQSDFQHVPTGSVTSAPNDFQHVLPDSVTSAPIVFQQVPTGSVTSAPVVFQRVPPGSVTSAPSDFQHAPPGSVTSAPNVSWHVPPGSVTSAPSDFQHAPPGYVTSAPIVFQQVPTGSVTSAPVVFQRVPPGSVTSAPTDFQHAPPGSVTSAPNVSRHVPPGSVTSAPSDFQHAPPGYVTSAPNVFQQALSGHVTSAPNLFQQVSPGSVISAPNVFQQVPTGYVTSAPNVSQQVPVGYVTNAPDASRHVHPGSVISAPNVSQHVPPGSMTPAPNGSHLVLTGSVSSATSVSGFETSAPSDFQHVPPGSITSAPNVCQHVPPGPLTSSPNVCQHVPPDSTMTSAPNVSQHVPAGSMTSAPNVSQQVLAGSPMSSPSVSPRVLSGQSTSINVHQHSSVVSSKEDQDPFILVSHRLSHQKSVVQHFGIEAHFSNNLFCLLLHEELKESHISDTRKVNGKKCTGKSNVSRSKRKCYRIKVFGKDTELFSESKHITHSIVKQHVKDLTSKKAVRNCIIICNGKVNCDKIFPNDNITVCPGLQGGGRQRELHGGAQCMSCFICKKAAAYTLEKYTHLIRKQRKLMVYLL